MVQGSARRPGLARSLLLRLARRALRAAGGHRLSGQGDEQLATRPRLGPVLPAPLLPLPARSERREPGGARRDRPHRRLLAAARRGRLPNGRRALPARDGGDPGGGGGRPARLPSQAALVRNPPARRDAAARRGEHRSEGARALLRRRGRRPAERPVRVPPQPEPLAVAGARGRRAARGGDHVAADRSARQRLGDVPAKPRRAEPRQAHRVAAQGGLRGLRAAQGHAAVRARPAPAHGDDAGR